MVWISLKINVGAIWGGNLIYTRGWFPFVPHSSSLAARSPLNSHEFQSLEIFSHLLCVYFKWQDLWRWITVYINSAVLILITVLIYENLSSRHDYVTSPGYDV